MSKTVNLLDTPLCPACVATWEGGDQCPECGFETSEPLPLRQLLADDLPDDADDDWRDLATFARMVAHATLDNSAKVGRLLGRVGR